MATPLRWVKLAGLIAALMSGCEPAGKVATNDEVKPKDGVSPELEQLARSLAGDDVRIARVFDHDGSRWALGVERGNAALAGVKPPPGTDGTPSVLLLLLDSKAKSAKWPLGAGRVLDAALASKSEDAIGYIDAQGRPCLRMGWAPTCAELSAEPVGMDVSAEGQLVFVANDGLGSHLFQVSVGASTPRRLTQGIVHHDRPVFDPDGKRVVFVGQSGGLSSLFVIDIANESVKQLTNVGKSLGPPGSENRIPEDFVPPPESRSKMSWDGFGIHYEAGGDRWKVSPTSGEASLEEVPR
jgi:hypothetical protein